MNTVTEFSPSKMPACSMSIHAEGHELQFGRHMNDGSHKFGSVEHVDVSDQFVRNGSSLSTYTRVAVQTP